MKKKNYNEISELVEFNLGGYSQKVLIEGKTKQLPVLISLHGGPGNPVPFSVGCRGLFPQFTNRFIMVYWDQLGCGINNHVIDDSFTIAHFVQMTEDLVMNVKKMFPDNKIFLFAVSWGSILSARLLEKNPHAVDGVVVNGQIIKNVFTGDEVKDTLSESKLPAGKLERIKKVTAENCTPDDLRLISFSLQKYTDGYQNKNGKPQKIGSVILGVLKSPDYSFKDFIAVVVNGYAKNTSLWNEIIRLDLSEALAKVEVPYIIVQGKTDVVASTKNVIELADGCKDQNLSYRIVENTGHYPGAEAMDEILNVLAGVTGGN